MTDHQRPAELVAKLAADDVAFRTEVLVQLGRIDVTLTNVSSGLSEVKSSLADHVRDDNNRFGTVNQKIGDNSSSIAKGVGICAALVAMIGVIMWIIDKVRP